MACPGLCPPCMSNADMSQSRVSRIVSAANRTATCSVFGMDTARRVTGPSDTVSPSTGAPPTNATDWRATSRRRPSYSPESTSNRLREIRRHRIRIHRNGNDRSGVGRSLCGPYHNICRHRMTQKRDRCRHGDLGPHCMQHGLCLRDELLRGPFNPGDIGGHAFSVAPMAKEIKGRNRQTLPRQIARDILHHLSRPGKPVGDDHKRPRCTLRRRIERDLARIRVDLALTYACAFPAQD